MTSQDLKKRLAKLHGCRGEAGMDRDTCLDLARSCAAYNLRRASRLVTQAFDQALKPVELKVTQFSLLVSFILTPNSNLAQLSKWLGMDRTTLSRNLKLLEKRGLVKMEPGEDRREQLVTITPDGEEAVQKAVPLWLQAQERVVGAMGDEKWAAMAKDLRAMVSGLK